MVAPIFFSLASNLLSFVGDICGMEGKLYSSWLCVPWVQKHLQLIIGTPNPLGVQVGLGYIHLINGMGHHFPVWFYVTPSCPQRVWTS